MSSLAMESETALMTRTASKSSLPFTILNTEGSSPVLHLFEIPSDKTVFGLATRDHPKFGVVTMNGCIAVFDTMVSLINSF